MGAFKPLLPFGENTVIESCLANLSAAGVENLIVVAGFHAEEIGKQLKDNTVTIVTNNDPNSEMSASISIGINALNRSDKAVLITPADHPAVPPRIITSLMQRWIDGASLVQPEHNGKGGHPVLIDLRYRHELAGLNSQSSLRDFFSNHRDEVVRVSVDSAYVARDMDTWEDYVRLHRDVFGDAPEKK